MRFSFFSRFPCAFLHPGKLVLTGIVLAGIAGVGCFQSSPPLAAAQSAVERGRLVYLSEGCDRCHLQDVQSGTDAVGNGRKGPDLSVVGARRSALWLKMHLYDPREVSGTSVMPSYASLFRTAKGNDLVAYLASLRGATNAHRVADEQPWHLASEAVATARPADGRVLYERYCATCHNPNGRTRVRWQTEFIESPAILRAGALQAESAAPDHLAQIIKFGIPDSDMAGHESLPDQAIASLIAWLTQNQPQPPSKK